MRNVVVTTLGALALAACGKSGGEASPGAAGPSAPQTSASKAAAAPAGMPAWAGPMNGAPLETALAMPSGGGLLAYHTDAKPNEVVAYYDAQTAAGGLKKITQSPGNDHGGTGAIYASDPPGGDGSKRLTVSAGPEDGRTRVDITYRPGAS